MKQLKSEIIAIGTELLLGEISNTNAQWLSQQLAIYGIDTYYHTVVGDNPARVEDTFREAQKRSDIIIVSGGLGPTEDDMTREAFQSMTQFEMEEYPPAMNKIKAYYARQHAEMTPNNRKQARIFTDSLVIENKGGMAPGMIVSYEGRTWIFLPGVPREMKQMAKDGAIPYMNKLSGQRMTIQSMTLRFIGIGESLLEHELQDLIQSQKNPTIAPLAQNDGVVIRLTAKEASVEKAMILLEETKSKILGRVGDYFYGLADETIEEKVYTMLKEQNKRIAAAESVTAGMFTERLISVSGASEVCPGGIVCYDPQVKSKLLNISKDLIHSNGVVSEECALQLATNICGVLDSDLGISFTGVAGPNSLEDHSVGTVYIALCSSQDVHHVEKFTFQGDRNSIWKRATTKGFQILFDFLKSAR